MNRRKGRLLTLQESDRVVDAGERNGWRSVFEDGYQPDDLVLSPHPLAAIPLWARIVHGSARPDYTFLWLRDLRGAAVINGNALSANGRNFLWISDAWQYPRTLAALLDAGLDAAHVWNGQTYFEYWTSMYSKWPGHMEPWAHLLVAWGCPFPLQDDTAKPTYADGRRVHDSIALAATRYDERKSAARRACIALAAGLRRILGRDIARMVARLVWGTRRNPRSGWKPVEEQTIN